MNIPSWILWILAVLITLATAIHQRFSGPTYPVRGQLTLNNHQINYRLPRSHPGAGDALIKIETPSNNITGTYTFRRYRSHDDWTTRPLKRTDNHLVAHLPHQPPAGKIMYRITLSSNNHSSTLTPDPVIIRFRGSVPAPVLITHIITIFAGMLTATRTGLEALLRKNPRPQGLLIATIIFLTLGGLIFGPLVQKYAFNAFWTGWPFGHDLTDNKTAVAVLIWLLALWRTWNKPTARAWLITASLATLIVWLIPHSMLGSELDYTQLPPTGGGGP